MFNFFLFFIPMEYLEVQDSHLFNFAITYSLLTKKGIKIQIKDNKESKEDYLRFMCSITKDSSYKYDANTKTFLFNPGVFLGGKFTFNCKDEISNYIVPLLPLLPFNSSQIFIKFIGVTNNTHSAELIRIAHFTLLKHFEIPNLEIVVKKTGFYPEGQGEVELYCGSISQIKSIELSQTPELETTRALLISSRLNSTYIAEMTTIIKELLGDLNLKIYSNVHNSEDSGPSPGFQCTMFMESKVGIFYTIKIGKDSLPQEVAKAACLDLLKSANRGGVFDEKLFPLLFSYLALSSTDISSIAISRITEELDAVLDLLKLFFNYTFSLNKQGDSYIVKSAGCGYKNMNKKIN